MVIPIIAALFVVVTVGACIFEMCSMRRWFPRETYLGAVIAVPLFCAIVIVWLRRG